MLIKDYIVFITKQSSLVKNKTAKHSVTLYVKLRSLWHTPYNTLLLSLSLSLSMSHPLEQCPACMHAPVKSTVVCCRLPFNNRTLTLSFNSLSWSEQNLLRSRFRQSNHLGIITYLILMPSYGFLVRNKIL